jgi:2-oxoisovalerate dehydrogenase E1 component
MANKSSFVEDQSVDFDTFKQEVLADFKLACMSRETSILGRKEVLTGKAKFGIFGDGKEVAQLALAKQFRKGDFRSGYYRDQTMVFALGELTIQEYFAGLYAHTDVDIEPTSAGRQMGGHFATRNIDQSGHWVDLMKHNNIASDISPTAGQMSRMLGLAQASKVYKEHPTLKDIEYFKKFTKDGDEIVFGTIGDASTSEGVFWESINAAGVLQLPILMSVWDDGYGISVPTSKQTTKGSISEVLAGFQRTEEKAGWEIMTTVGWDYSDLVETFEKAAKIVREERIPVFVHVKEVNQPQGHSSSGSHEHYKPKERLQWEKDFDCILKFKQWIADFNIDGLTIASLEELEDIEKQSKEEVRIIKNEAWKSFCDDIQKDIDSVLPILNNVLEKAISKDSISKDIDRLLNEKDLLRKDVYGIVRSILRQAAFEHSPYKDELSTWVKEKLEMCFDRYSTHIYSQSDLQAILIDELKPNYSDDNQLVDGRIILKENYHALFKKYPETLIFGEDVGGIGGVNKSCEGLQSTFGELRVFDTGIRENTIIGQGIGMAMRGLRPIAEIQYLDYLIYALQIMSDDLATLQYRTKGGQKAPLIISTRGHRLEGIWHSGSPMGMIINAVRGMIVCVPRNMTKAAGFYNTLLESDDCALVIEPLNGYRTKERLPINFGEFKTPIGIPEIVVEGNDLTMVSYGSTFNICEKATSILSSHGISVELIDIQTLLPFDVNHIIGQSVAKTNRLLIVDEDVSGGASGFILDKLMNEQNVFFNLDSSPISLTAKDHRPAYGSDGDYFSKPNLEDIIEKVIEIMHEVNPSIYPQLY